MIIAPFIVHGVNYLLGWIGLGYTVGVRYGLYAGLYVAASPIYLIILLLWSIGILSHLPESFERDYYDQSYNKLIEKKINENSEAIAKFGSPITRLDNRIADKDIKMDKHHVIIANRFAVEGPKGKGFVYCIATANRNKIPWSTDKHNWNIEYQDVAPVVHKFKDGVKENINITTTSNSIQH